MAKKVVLSILEFPTRNHKVMVRDVLKYFKKNKIKYHSVDACHASPAKFGGDGTFLRASHYIDHKTDLLSINTDPDVKEGFFSTISRDNYKDRLKQLFDGKYKVKLLTRLDTKIGNKKIETALNEVFIGSASPYLMSRYNIKLNSKEEFQKSSGLIISTASGSHAWLGSAGGHKLPKLSERIQYLPRDVYMGTLTRAKLLGGFVQTELKITPVRMCDFIVVIDSLSKEYLVPDGTTIKISKSKSKLRMIYF